MGPLGPVEIAVLVVLVAVPLLGIVDASQLPASAFRSAGHSKRFWILAQILLGYIGAVIYFAGIRADVRFFSAPPSPDWEEASGDEAELLGDRDVGDSEVGDSEVGDPDVGD